MEVNEPALDYKPKMTIEQYLEFENASPEKHEYYKGEVFAMSGASETHEDIVLNTVTSIKQFLKGKNCKPKGSNFRVCIENSELFTYPDISIFCDRIITCNNDKRSSINPSVLIEVLSPSTRDYDKGLKYELHQRIESLKEYILIDSEKIHIEVFLKSSNEVWASRQFKSIDDILLIQTIQMEIPLRTIYEETNLL